jgi:hypothetical protein
MEGRGASTGHYSITITSSEPVTRGRLFRDPDPSTATSESDSESSRSTTMGCREGPADEEPALPEPDAAAVRLRFGLGGALLGSASSSVERSMRTGVDVPEPGIELGSGPECGRCEREELPLGWRAPRVSG